MKPTLAPLPPGMANRLGRFVEMRGVPDNVREQFLHEPKVRARAASYRDLDMDDPRRAIEL